jgi:hypothetical protein
MGEKIIADALDTALARHYEKFGDAEREKQAVVFLSDRWLAIEGSYTPEEIREGLEQIQRQRLVKRLSESLKEISPFTVEDGQVFIHEELISADQSSLTTHKEGVEAIVKSAIELQLKPGGSIWRMINEGRKG